MDPASRARYWLRARATDRRASLIRFAAECEIGGGAEQAAESRAEAAELARIVAAIRALETDDPSRLALRRAVVEEFRYRAGAERQLGGLMSETRAENQCESRATEYDAIAALLDPAPPRE